MSKKVTFGLEVRGDLPASCVPVLGQHLLTYRFACNARLGCFRVLTVTTVCVPALVWTRVLATLEWLGHPVFVQLVTTLVSVSQGGCVLLASSTLANIAVAPLRWLPLGRVSGGQVSQFCDVSVQNMAHLKYHKSNDKWGF